MNATPEFNLELSSFNGPLDVLWDKLKIAELQIDDLNILDVLQQYQLYVDFCLKNGFLLSQYSKYLILCSKLILWRSQLLLPNPAVDTLEADQAQAEQDRIKRLTMYSQLKQLANKLKESSQQNAQFLGKESSDYTLATAAKVKPSPEQYTNKLNIDLLTKSFEQAIALFKYRNKLETKMLKPAVSSYIMKCQILNYLAKYQKTDQHFEKVLLRFADHSLASLLHAFIVLLELVMHQNISIIYKDQKIYLHYLNSDHVETGEEVPNG